MKINTKNTAVIGTIIGVSTLTFLSVKYLSKNSNKLLDKLTNQAVQFLDNVE